MRIKYFLKYRLLSTILDCSVARHSVNLFIHLSILHSSFIHPSFILSIIPLPFFDPALIICIQNFIKKYRFCAVLGIRIQVHWIRDILTLRIRIRIEVRIPWNQWSAIYLPNHCIKLIKVYKKKFENFFKFSEKFKAGL